jgi:hypothetical protein
MTKTVMVGATFAKGKLGDGALRKPHRLSARY